MYDTVNINYRNFLVGYDRTIDEKRLGGELNQTSNIVGPQPSDPFIRASRPDSTSWLGLQGSKSVVEMVDQVRTDPTFLHSIPTLPMYHYILIFDFNLCLNIVYKYIFMTVGHPELLCGRMGGQYFL